MSHDLHMPLVGLKHQDPSPQIVQENTQLMLMGAVT
jgi:hypothetical protein